MVGVVWERVAFLVFNTASVDQKFISQRISLVVRRRRDHQNISTTMPAAIVFPDERSMNRPSSLMLEYSSRQIGCSVAISTKAFEFLTRHRGFEPFPFGIGSPVALLINATSFLTVA